MSNQYRTSNSKGLINKEKIINFTFNGSSYQGYEGDTLASALIANGVHLIGRSFKYHRPRGFLGVGVEEPNAMVQLHEGDRSEPNIMATEVELVEGLKAKSQNCWPSVKFDIGEINNLLNRFFSCWILLQNFYVAQKFLV
jgi:NADPH-dependent 2,4-dienoyl-CoA reductase/sulfur reductase-like enzyme